VVTAPGAQTVTFTAKGVGLAATAVSTGLANCAVTTGGGVVCWGANPTDEVGANYQYVSIVSANTLPVAVPGVTNVVSLTSSAWGPCALTSSGTGYCWGEVVPLTPCITSPCSYWGVQVQTPTAIPSVPALSQIVEGGTQSNGTEYYPSPSQAHRCLLTTAGAALCYGQNEWGQVGDGMPTAADTVVATPTAVVGGLTFTMLAAGGEHTCGIAVGGAVYCWGSDSIGQLGDGAPAALHASPVLINGLTAISIAAGLHHTCAVSTSGQAYCWGANNNSQLGDGTTTTRTTPVAVSGSQRFTTIAAGGDMTCALTTLQLAYCWGTYLLNAQPQPPLSNVPTAVDNAAPMTTIATSGSSACGVLTTGIAVCLGDIVGAGNNIFQNEDYLLYFASPVAVPPLGYSVVYPNGASRVARAAKPRLTLRRQPR
jgi:alpha-tubulin suppressor-like RCC1 family protein